MNYKNILTTLLSGLLFSASIYAGPVGLMSSVVGRSVARYTMRPAVQGVAAWFNFRVNSGVKRSKSTLERLDGSIETADSYLKVYQAFALRACDDMCNNAGKLREIITKRHGLSPLDTKNSVIARGNEGDQEVGLCKAVETGVDLLRSVDESIQKTQQEKNRLLQSYYFAQPAQFSC